MLKSSPKIALIDGHKELSMTYQQRLIIEGYEVIVFEDGEASMAYLLDVPVDLIMMEIILPKISGLELIELFKSDSRTSHVPIIVLTTKASLDYSQEAFALGADSYLIKTNTSANDALYNINKLLMDRNIIRS